MGLLRRSSRFSVDSRELLERLRSLLLPSLPSTTPSRLLMPGRMLPLLSSRTSRRPLVRCFLRTEVPGPWTSRRTSPPSWRSLLRMLRMSLSSCPKDKSAEGENQFSLEKMESTLGELKNIFKQKEKLVEDL